MRTSLRAWTYALYRGRDDALDGLPEGALGQDAVASALARYAMDPRVTGAAATRALDLIGAHPHPDVRDALLTIAMGDPRVRARCTAIEWLGRRDEALPWKSFVQRLRRDDAHHARRALVELLAGAPSPYRWDIVWACDDPHWRVRKAVLAAMHECAKEVGPERTRGALRLAMKYRDVDSDQARGVLAYLELYDAPERTIEACVPEPWGPPKALDLTARPWWSEEPLLVRAEVRRMSPKAVLEEERWLVWLLTHEELTLRSAVVTAWAHLATPRGVLSFLLLAAEPRRSGLAQTRSKLLQRLNQDTLEACAWLVLDAARVDHSLWEVAGLPALAVSEGAVRSWALTWLAAHVPATELLTRETWRDAVASSPEDVHAEVRAAAARLDPRPEVLERLAQDDDAWVAAAALDAGAAATKALAAGAHREVLAFRFALVEALAREGASGPMWEALCSDESAEVRVRCAQHGASFAEAPAWLEALQRDPVARVREAAMTVEWADAVLEAPQEERSWQVLARAGELCKRRLERAVPKVWSETSVGVGSVSDRVHVPAPLRGQSFRADSPRPLGRPPVLLLAGSEQHPFVSTTSWSGADARGDSSVVGPRGASARASDGSVEDWWGQRVLGATGLSVTRMGISGHYKLPVRGFEEAVARGVNTFFWEPLYGTQTRFFRARSAHETSSWVVCAGTFEASARGLRRDVERALRALGVEQIQVFYMFWVRDPARLSEEVLREMDRCKQEGLVGTFGVSTHDRGMARAFLEEWPVVMVRHNAAHRGVERELFPEVDLTRTGLITFSNLCYGRMISKLPGWGAPPPRARDAYRYSLTQPGVTSCWSAPSTVAQLRENLSALDAGPMSEDELEAMRAYGDALYRLNKGFDRFVRGR